MRSFYLQTIVFGPRCYYLHGYLIRLMGNYLISFFKKMDSVTILFAKQIMSYVLTFRINSKLGAHVLLSAGNIKKFGTSSLPGGP